LGIASGISSAQTSATTGTTADASVDSNLTPLVFVDSKGNVLGELIGTNQARVVLNGAKYIITLGAVFAPSQLNYAQLTYQEGQLYYATFDCSGQAYALQTGFGLKSGMTITQPNGAIWFYGLTAKPMTYMGINSYWSGGTCTPNSIGASYASPVNAPIDITTLLTPPVKIKED